MVKEKGGIMSANSLGSLGAVELRQLYSRRAVSPVEVVKACVERIAKYNPATNAVVTLAAEQAVAEAERAERQLNSGSPLPPLFGLPCLVKDNIMTAGIRSTSGSPLFSDHVPSDDAGVVAAAKKSGAIILGKTNTPSFGWKATTDNKVFGVTRNPYDLSLTPGGSSGGAAVAAATAMVPINIGTDGGGSLRIPAAFTGTVGFKPTHGRVPDVPPHTHWLIQHYGPISTRVSDIRLIFDAISCTDPRDPHSIPEFAVDHRRDAVPPPRALFTTQLGFVQAVDPEVASLCRAAAFSFRDIGWEVEERDLDWTDPAPFANVISAFGLASRLKGFEHRTDDIEDGISRILEAVKTLPNTAFYDAYVARNVWCAKPHQLFENVDLLMTPTVACAPFPVDSANPQQIDGSATAATAWSPYLRAFNITGQPAISVPAGFTSDGRPVGLQIVARRFADQQLIAAAMSFEAIRPWPQSRAVEAIERQLASRAP